VASPINRSSPRSSPTNSPTNTSGAGKLGTNILNTGQTVSSGSSNPVTSNNVSSTAGSAGVESLSSPAVNIPNDGVNYHWFLAEISGSRLTISPTTLANRAIRADMGINNIVNRILSHIGA